MHMSKEAYTHHARNRSTARNIPPGVIELILEYGEVSKARENGDKFSLSKKSLRELKRFYGRQIMNAIGPFRSAYVVMADGKVITVAWARKPLRH